MAVRLVDLRIPDEQEAGPLHASVSVGGELLLDVDLQVLEALPEVPVEPVLAFYRGRLVGERVHKTLGVFSIRFRLDILGEQIWPVINTGFCLKACSRRRYQSCG